MMKGSVEKHGSSWRYSIFLGTVDGKKKYQRKSGFKTQREAQRALREVLHSMDTGTYVPPTQLTVADYLSKWLEDKATVVRFGTLRKYHWMINYRIIPSLGSIAVQSLTPQHVQSFYNNLKQGDKPLSDRSVLHIHRLLHEAMDRALKWGFVARNVVDAVETPTAKPAEMRVWTSEEASRFLQVARANRYYVAFALAIETGMRQGEIIALRWCDVDLDEKFLHVERTDYLGHINPPKTVKGRRGISLTSSLVKTLRWHKAAQAKERLLLGEDYQDNGLIVAKFDGTPLRARSLVNHWYKLLDESGLPRIRFHDLRHTHASILFDQGADPKEVSEALGHSDVAFTWNQYTHMYRRQKEKLAMKLETALHGQT